MAATRVVSEEAKRRYNFSTLDELHTRVAQRIFPGDSFRDSALRSELRAVMDAGLFYPSGNVLAAAPGDEILPGCCVLGAVTPENEQAVLVAAERCWSLGTGTGIHLSHRLGDPIATLLRFAERKLRVAEQSAGRPSRGCMVTMSASNKHVKEFCSLKTELHGKARELLAGFNLSVSVHEKDVGEEDSPVLRAIAINAWSCGEPGVIFIDRVRATDPASGLLEPLKTAVPCGEQLLHANECCVLGAINLAAVVDDGGRIDLSLLRAAVEIGVRSLDRLVDSVAYPLPQMRTMATLGRRIGLGVSGWADALVAIGMPYDSPEAVKLGSQVAEFITKSAESTSAQLGRELGVPELCRAAGLSRRNLTVTCVQPTGGVSVLMGNSGYAIEPHFGEAASIAASAHVQHQAAWQAFVHNAISKTINLPESATPGDIVKAMRYACVVGCKGLCVFRDRCLGETAVQPKELGSEAVVVDSDTEMEEAHVKCESCVW